MYHLKILFIIIIIIIIYFIYLKTKQVLSVKNYLINTYLYISLAISIITLTWLFMSNYEYGSFKTTNNITKIFIAFIILLILLYFIIYLGNDKIILKHTIWVVFMLLTAYVTYIFYEVNVNNDTLKKTLIELFIIVISFTFLAIYLPPDIFIKWKKILMYSLIIMIIIEIIIFFVSDKKNFFNKIKMTSFIIIIIFCGFLLYDTQKIVKNGMTVTNKCISKNQFICADYPKESMGIFLDIVNLFERITILSITNI